MPGRDDVIDILIRLRRLPKFRKDARSAQRAIEGVSDEVDEAKRRTVLYTKANGSLRNELRDLIKTHQEHTKALHATDGVLKQTNTLFAFFRNVMRTLAIPIAITSMGLLAQSLSIVLGGVTALVSALGPLSGYLLALPAAISTVGQAVSIAKFAFSDLFQALGGSAAALDRLTVPGLGLFTLLNSLKPVMLDLRETAQKGMFPGVEAGIQSMLKNLNVIKPIISSTAKILGGIASRAGSFIGSKGFGQDLAAIAKTNDTVIFRLGNALLRIFKGIVDISVAARPLLLYVSRLATAFSKWFEATAKGGRESGKLNVFFRRTIYITNLLLKLFKNLGGAILNIAKIAAPFGRQILRDLTRASESFKAWTDSARGKNQIKKYFRDIMPALYEMGRLMRDIIKLFLNIGRGSHIAALIKQLRTEFIPVLGQIVNRTTAAFGPAMISALTGMLRLFAQLSEETGPLTILLKVFAGFSNALAGLLETAPIIRHLVTGIIILKFALAGLFYVGTGSVTMWKRLKQVWKTSADILRALGIQSAIETARLKLMYFWEAMQVKAIKLWAFWNRILTVSMLGIPVVAIVAGIIALGAAIFLAYKKIGWFHRAVDRAWDILKSLGAWILKRWPIIMIAMTGGLAILPYLFIKNFGKIKNVVRGTLSWIRTAFSNLVSFIAGIPGKIWNASKGMFNGFANAFKVAMNWIIRRWDRLNFKIGGWKIHGPGPLPDFKIPKIAVGLPQIPLLGYGGSIMDSGSAIVGDRGPEILNMPRGASIAPLTMSQAAAATSVDPIFNRSSMGGDGRPQVIQLVVGERVLAEVTNRANSDRLARE